MIFTICVYLAIWFIAGLVNFFEQVSSDAREQADYGYLNDSSSELPW